MKVLHQVQRTHPATVIREETGGKLRSFLYELAEGVTTYRTVHSLTEQVQHQYHGRFVIELIQNAYDALSRDPDLQQSLGRIEMRLAMDGEFGTLYVANDGAPFSDSNFRSVSRLGQSDKNPATSIGNKGIGFRSVLEVSRQPRIWSKLSKERSSFDGYCFGFDPAFANSILEPVVALIERRELSTPDMWFGELLDWDESWLNRLRVGIRRQAVIEGLSEREWLRTQIGYLSPYLLPWPLAVQNRPDTVGDFEAEGFSTVLALPLTSATAAKLVGQKLAAIDAASLLFLENLRELTLSVPGETRRFSRSIERAATGDRRFGEVAIGPVDQQRRFRTWNREIAVLDMPEVVRSSIRGLPGHWPSLNRVEITLAVGTCATPEPGKLSIFLPTKLETGAALHINAPFFGDMSRTTIYFGEQADDAQAGGAYNDFLLQQAAALALDAITEDLQGGTMQDAADILDILAPNATDNASVRRWQEHVLAVATGRGMKIPEAPWVLSDRGWTALSETSVLPLAPDPKVLTAEMMRNHAAFPAYAVELDGRAGAIKSLSESFGKSVLPSREDQAATIERAAKALVAAGNVEWSSFWEDVCQILDDDLSHLRGREVLLCTDGTLHAGGLEGRAIYFRPRQTGQDDDVFDEQAIDQIPAALQPLIAILDPSVPVTEVREGRRQNSGLHKRLNDAGLVDQFRREEVLTNVLIPNLPAMPVRHGTPEVALCRDTLSYAMRLTQSMETRGDGQGILKALAKLPVPCRGGWFALATSSFGWGWPETQGPVVAAYLRLARTESSRAVRDRLLRAPDHIDWGSLGVGIRTILRDAGVHDGLPLVEIGGKEPAFRFDLWNQRFQLPQTSPLPIDNATWTKFSSSVAKLTSVYKSGKYKVDRLYWLPGLERYTEFDESTRIAFFDVVMHSASRWRAPWRTASLTRDTGTYEVKDIASPLSLAFSTLDWISGPAGDGVRVWNTPSERWYVPSRHIARGRAWTFEHLSPLSPETAAMLEQEEGLAAFLKSVGVPVYEPDRDSSDSRLLKSLSQTADQKTYRNKDVFLGQLRAAWDAFHPGSPNDFPSQIVVQQPDGSLPSTQPSDENPVYLPSERMPATALRDLGLPVVAIEPKSARRLAENFSYAYGTGIRNSEHFEMAALSGDRPWNDDAADLLSNFGALDGVVPFLLTIAAFHGSNAQGTTSSSFNDMVRDLREARVAVVPDLTVVPTIGDRQIAIPRRQIAAWLARRRVLTLDTGWKNDIEAVADAFTQLIGRSDLRFQNRKGLSAAWQSDDDQALEGILRQMDLTPEHYGGVLELWRGDLGPVIARLSILLRVVERPDLSSRLELAEQREQILPVLVEGLPTAEDAEAVLHAAINSRSIFQFGTEMRELLGAKVELSAWNSELVCLGETGLSNPQSDTQFARHREQALPALRRLVATLAARTPGTPSYADGMKQVDALRCTAAVSQAYWEVPFSEVMSAIGQELVEAGFPTETRQILDDVISSGPVAFTASPTSGVTEKDPVETAALNRRYFEGVFERFALILTAWHANLGKDESSSWLVGITADPANSLREDRDLYTQLWDEERALSSIAGNLPVAAPQEVRQRLAAVQTLNDLMASLQVLPEQMQGAEDKLAAVHAEVARRKRLVQVCGADIENSERSLAGLFAHIAAQITNETVQTFTGFDIEAALIPKKAKKPAPGGKRDGSKRTLAPKRTSKNMEDLVGASGEIHAFRWLQLKYGSTTVSPSNWVSAYSAKAYPDNAVNVDEGRGCDIFFTIDGCTYSIEIKSSEGETTNFTLGTSEIRRAREVAATKRRKPFEQFLILKVDHVLSTSPTFTLLPNPYDPRYQDHFVIIDDGARVSYRT